MTKLNRKIISIIVGVVFASIVGGSALFRFVSEGNVWGVVLNSIFMLAVAYVWYYFDNRNREFIKKLSDYVNQYHLTSKDLGEITGFSQYDFTLDNKRQMGFVYMYNKKKREQVLLALHAYEENLKEK